jgi:hypothetical protein
MGDAGITHTGIRPSGSDSSEKLFPQTSERIVFEVGLSDGGYSG